METEIYLSVRMVSISLDVHSHMVDLKEIELVKHLYFPPMAPVAVNSVDHNYLLDGCCVDKIEFDTTKLKQTIYSNAFFYIPLLEVYDKELVSKIEQQHTEFVKKMIEDCDYTNRKDIKL